MYLGASVPLCRYTSVPLSLILLCASLLTLSPAVALQAQEPQQGWTLEDEDEEQAPTWAEDVRAQALDIGAVAAFSVLAFVSFFRKSVALKYVTLVVAVGYLGFYKSQLVSIVNVFGLFGGSLPIFRYNLAWYLLVAITGYLSYGSNVQGNIVSMCTYLNISSHHVRHL